MKKNYIFVIVVAILILLIVIVYVFHKSKKNITLKHKKNESICILSIILTIIKI